MAEIILVIGGNSSGKTRYALSLCPHQPRIYIATGLATDREMHSKILNHRRERSGWDTLVLPTLMPSCLEEILALKDFHSTVIDCMGFFVSNCMMERIDPLTRLKTALGVLQKKIKERVVIVSNEVGLSPVAPTSTGREFVKLMGKLNSMLSSIAARVFIILAGIPLELHNYGVEDINSTDGPLQKAH